MTLAPWQVRNFTFDWTRTYLMGVLNVTPDSFSDGGQFDTLDRAIAQAHRMVTDGADILDIGGQSTRPNAETVTLEEELRRVVPVVKALRAGNDNFAPLDVPISVDTTRVEVAEGAMAAGAAARTSAWWSRQTSRSSTRSRGGVPTVSRRTTSTASSSSC